MFRLSPLRHLHLPLRPHLNRSSTNRTVQPLPANLFSSFDDPPPPASDADISIPSSSSFSSTASGSSREIPLPSTSAQGTVILEDPQSPSLRFHQPDASQPSDPRASPSRASPTSPTGPPPEREPIHYVPWGVSGESVTYAELAAEKKQRIVAAVRLFTEEDVMPGEIARRMTISIGTVRSYFLTQSRSSRTIFHQIRYNWIRAAFEEGQYSLSTCPTIEDAFVEFDKAEMGYKLRK